MTDSDLDTVRRIIFSGFGKHKACVFLFGSRANGSARAASDIDVGILPAEHLPQGLLSEIRLSLHDSNVSYAVDLVDISQADLGFRKRVIEEGILWKGSSNE